MDLEISRHTVDRGFDARFYAHGFHRAKIYRMAQLAMLVTRDIWSPCLWRDGRRGKADFLAADFIGLDYDEPVTTLDEAQRLFAPYTHVIGTTKSHQKEKGGVTCDRFRVVLRLERRAETLADYEATAEIVFARYGTDLAVKDGGRFFWPCAEIVSIREEGETLPVMAGVSTPAASNAAREYDLYRLRRFKQYPGWLSAFLERGKLTKRGGRNNTIYAAAVALAGFGMPEAQAVEMIRAAPFDRRDFDDREILGSVKSGYRGGT